jgi:3-(3-hydroxy-phenyl)propionate hydroxylase
MSYTNRVVIVGAGPVGLSAALSLSLSGVPVLLLEAEHEFPKEQRGAAFHPPTLEMLAKLGVVDEVLAQGIKIPVWQMRDRFAGLIAEFDLGLLAQDTPFPYRLHLPQHYLSSILYEKLRLQANVEIRFGHRLQNAEPRSDSVLLTVIADGQTEYIDAPWVIGCDGSRSVVRKSMEIEFEGFTWPEKFLVTNIDYPLEELGFTGTAYITDAERWAVVLRLADPKLKNLWRIAMPADPDIDDKILLQPDAVQARLCEMLPGRTSYPLVYASTYRVHQRVAATFYKQRVFLAGDAAHINNPLGGFGLNGGVHDAFNLAEKLASIWHGTGSHDLCDWYSRQRRTVATEVVQANSIRNKKKIRRSNWKTSANWRQPLPIRRAPSNSF